MAKYQIVGLTSDGKRVGICYTRSAFEARLIQAKGDPKFSQLLVLGKDGELTPAELDDLVKASGASDA